LWMQGVAATDAGVAHFAGMVELNELDLRRTQITDAGLLHLKNCAKMQILHVGETAVSAAGARELKKSLPACYMPPYTGGE
ncbi:MAG: hypothetical protein JNG89_06590, partial [Planctomycetaceae bacterium]|nr:hypothetical protein [Planctomycetaceae bacterium]